MSRLTHLNLRGTEVVHSDHLQIELPSLRSLVLDGFTHAINAPNLTSLVLLEHDPPVLRNFSGCTMLEFLSVTFRAGSSQLVCALNNGDWPALRELRLHAMSGHAQLVEAFRRPPRTQLQTLHWTTYSTEVSVVLDLLRMLPS